MTVTEIEKIASRLYALVNEAWEFGQNRNDILALVEEYANDLQDEADELAEAIAESCRSGPYETDLWYDTSKELA
jgi:uncharacterized coiled-coil DUF342 family protein